MGYQKTKFENINPIISRLESLREGQILTLEDNAVSIGRVRHLLYSYLHTARTKEYFKLSRPSPRVLQIMRTPSPNPKMVVLGGTDPRIEEFVIDNLLEVSNEDAAIELIQNGLPQDLWVEAVDEWRRVIGHEQEPEGGQPTPDCKI